MYADNFLSLSSVQTVTGTNTSVLSTNTIDLGVARDMGAGGDLFGRFQVGTSASGGTSVEFQVIATDLDRISKNTDKCLARGLVERIPKGRNAYSAFSATESLAA